MTDRSGTVTGNTFGVPLVGVLIVIKAPSFVILTIAIILTLFVEICQYQ
ncbi:MAG: hypothetical protein LBG93_04195 [Treponema sp.]|nr:hypothetical protein [Treponema sp.]